MIDAVKKIFLISIIFVLDKHHENICNLIFYPIEYIIILTRNAFSFNGIDV